jgi:Protein of unknown function (DUF3429)
MHKMSKWALDEVPRPALILGLGGLLPFLALAVVARFAPDRLLSILADSALLYYAAAILSFMGGAQWGLAMRPTAAHAASAWRAYGVAVLPALAAAGIQFATTVGMIAVKFGHIAFAVSFIGLLGYDLWTVRRGEAPGWYRPLRIALTAIVVIALLIAGVR